MQHITQDDIVLGASLGLDLTPEGLRNLTPKQREVRWQTYISKAMHMEPLAIQNAGFIQAPDEDLPQYFPDNSKPIPDSIKQSGKRENFKVALEDALWELGGVHYLVSVGKSAPIEFLKIASRLVNVDNSAAKDGIKFIMEFTEPNVPELPSPEIKEEGGQDL